ncbi:RICIN domain-containing protein [Thalassoroseus pseudoceratinae]|uniref:RICIN domain-containing protein n=1 Tax=Thalassoroseus pseudoceratinae TaxID=2713176 RepID=UPI00142307E0|nr:RICIN domain-containing protein [Thalassoroseus pseudoceratinae]
MRPNNRRLLTFVLLLMCTGPVFAQPKAGRSYYLEHIRSGKYMSAHSDLNAAGVHIWGPIHKGDEMAYRFKLVESGEDEHYYLIHQLAEKCLVTRGTDNGALAMLWGPIPAGHEDRYKFKLIKKDDGSYYLFHKWSGKHLGLYGRANGNNFYLHGPITPEIENEFKFRFTAADELPKVAERSRPAKKPKKKDRFEVASVWGGTARDSNKTKINWAMSISKRNGDHFEGAIAITDSKGRKFEAPIKGTGPADGDGVVIIESPLGKDKWFGRGKIVDGKIELAYTSTGPRGTKIFGAGTLTQHK